MQQHHHRCDRDLSAAGRQRAGLWVAAASLAVSCLVAVATPSVAEMTPEPKAAAATAAAPVAPAAPKAKAASKPKAGGAKLRVSPYAKFRREREAAERANGSAPRPGSDHPAGQAAARRIPK